MLGNILMTYGMVLAICLFVFVIWVVVSCFTKRKPKQQQSEVFIPNNSEEWSKGK